MSTTNRERRKTRQKERARRNRNNASRWPHEHHDSYQCPDCGQHHSLDPMPTPEEVVGFLLDQACVAIRVEDAEELDVCVNALLHAGDDLRWAALVHRTFQARFAAVIRLLWSGGWQPADVVRLMNRRFGARHARMTTDLVAAQRREYATATVAESWDAQLAGLGATVWWTEQEGYLASFGRREDLSQDALYRCCLEVLSTFGTLPRLEILVPVPGTARRGSLAPSQPGDARPDERMLDRVRALLAKAESTEYTEEAEALTAKAQELMTRHSIDYALLAASTGSRDTPVGIRVGIDNPYEDPKATLLQRVAEANDCRAAFSKHLGFSTVVGFARDVEAVELLFTSLLVQATAAMMRAGSRADGSGRSRTRSFRQSFLNAYAIRIGQRLQEATEEVGRTAAAETGTALVPVMAAKRAAVREAAETYIGDVVQRPFTISNHEGWVSGTAAADLANVNARRGVAAQ